MYYSKEELEKLRKEFEEQVEKQDRALEKTRQGSRYSLLGEVPFKCTCCGNDYFQKGSALLNTRGATFFNLDWLNQSATTLMCTNCTYIHWFGKDLQPKED